MKWLQQNENNKKAICVNVDGILIITNGEAACKAPVAIKEVANFMSKPSSWATLVKSEMAMLPIRDRYFFIFNIPISPSIISPPHPFKPVLLVPCTWPPPSCSIFSPPYPHAFPFFKYPLHPFLSHHNLPCPFLSLPILHSSHTHYIPISPLIISPPLPFKLILLTRMLHHHPTISQSPLHHRYHHHLHLSLFCVFCRYENT